MKLTSQIVIHPRRKLRKELIDDVSRLVIVHSPFSRTCQTAACVAGEMGIDNKDLKVGPLSLLPIPANMPSHLQVILCVAQTCLLYMCE